VLPVICIALVLHLGRAIQEERVYWCGRVEACGSAPICREHHVLVIPEWIFAGITWVKSWVPGKLPVSYVLTDNLPLYLIYTYVQLVDLALSSSTSSTWESLDWSLLWRGVVVHGALGVYHQPGLWADAWSPRSRTPWLMVSCDGGGVQLVYWRCPLISPHWAVQTFCGAHWLNGDVLLSNSAFFIGLFAV